MNQVNKIKLFYSYSHEDERTREDIQKHLAILKTEGLICEWYDRKLQSGKVFRGEIDKQLESSDLILLLLSPDFFLSSECRREMEIAFGVKEKHNAVVVPVIVRPCAWRDDKRLSEILAIPRDGKAISQWSDKDEALLNIYENIKGIVNSLPAQLKPLAKSKLTRVEFVSQHKDDLNLDDLFVFPNLKAEYRDREIDDFDDLWKKNKRIILKGDDRCGKTVFCRKLFLHEVKKGNPVLLISGEDIKSPINHEQVIERKFGEQFTGSFPHWSQQFSKCLIIDDFTHNSPLKFVDFAKGYFDRVLFVISEDDYLAYFSDEERFAGYELLNLGSIGHVKQEELIRKWVNLSDDQYHQQTIPHGKIDLIEDRLNSIILHSRIVPRYPFYILSILQTFEAFMPQNLQITTYGHCYHALIVAQLLKIEINKEDIDSSLNFLTALSYEIYKEREFTQIQFDRFLNEYNENYLIKTSVVSRLMNHNSSIIRSREGRYEFSYPFVYYFLLGNYFARNYQAQLDTIEQITEKSYLKDNAFILIFTIHHAQDDELIDNILLHTACALDDVIPATLDLGETKLLETALQELPERILSKRSVEDERRLERVQREESEAQSDGFDNEAGHDDDDNPQEHLNSIYKTLKNMEILGQILKNKFGSFTKRKNEEVIEFVADAGLRLINKVLDKEGIQRFEGYLIESLKTSDISEDDKPKLERFLRNQVRTLVFIIIGSLLYKVTMSIRKPDLYEIVESMCRRRNTPAGDLILAFFILETAEDDVNTPKAKKIIDIINQFDKSHNVVARRLLSFSLQHYANTHHIPRRAREKLFQALKIDYRPNPYSKRLKQAKSS